MEHQSFAIIDCGAQYVQLIARRLREQHVYCEIFPSTVPADELKEYDPKGIIISGGPASVYDDNARRPDEGIYEMGIPVLGICYGMQVMAHQLGGKVIRAERKEFGRVDLEIVSDDELMHGIGKNTTCWMSHGDEVLDVPNGFKVSATTPGVVHAAMGNRDKNLYGVQFHPEVAHTPQGVDVIRNFLYRICKASGDWTMESFIDAAVADIRTQVGDRRVLCGLSGGVDSAVTAALLHRAIGDRLTCMFVDHGLMRKDEGKAVAETFGNMDGLNFVHVDAADRFLDKLSGVIDPERKRKIVGNEFINVFESESEKLGQFDFLAQGTLYPDVIESGTRSAALIKTHHNVGGLPERMKMKLVEPVRELFKDEVRQLGKELGLSDDIVNRQPFPGPGLSIRIIGEVTRQKLDILRQADAIVTQELSSSEVADELWQFFAVLVSVKTVGVMGDARSYAYPIVIRAVSSVDGMTADWARLPHDLVSKISNRIINEVEHVNRVVLDVTSKPPGTIEWE